jgi:hypothetical protein
MGIRRILGLLLRRRRHSASWSAADGADVRRTAVVRDLEKIRRDNERNRPRKRNTHNHSTTRSDEKLAKRIDRAADDLEG